MKVIHVLRKPLSEKTVAANTLRHGCGGLNIDTSRVGKEPRESAQKDFSAVWGNKWGSGAHLPTTGTKTVSGRWPANMILQHLDGCRCDGVKKVKGVAGTAQGKMAGKNTEVYGVFAGSNRAGERTGYVDKDGNESVANWICVEGCPVKALDEQSGVLTSGTKLPHHRRNVPRMGHGGVYFAGDSGGASRFFKQVGGKFDG